MKKLYIIILSALAVLNTSAQTSEGFDRLILKFVDGGTEEFYLGDDVVLIPALTTFVVKCDGHEYVYDRNSLAGIYYHEEVSGIGAITVDNSGDVYVNDDNIASFNGLYDDCSVEIFTVDGRLVSAFRVGPGSNHIDLSYLPHGVYLVRRADETYKITVR